MSRYYRSSSPPSSPPVEPPPEKTICVIKPEAYSHRDEIIARLKSENFTILNHRSLTLSRAQAHRLYTQHFNSHFFPQLINSVTASPVYVLLLSKVDCVAELRRLVGPTDPVIAKQVSSSSLRALYGRDVIANGVHASRDNEAAYKEEDCFFYIIRRTMIIFGAPASGKGTQCELLCSAYDLVHISTGDLLRNHIRDRTEIGMKIKPYVDSGRLVPDDLITELTLNRLSHHDCATRGFILDGFPRTATQATSLIDAGVEISRFIFLTAETENLISRVTGRRFDPVTGKTYHIVNNPPPESVASRCIQRKDDDIAIVRKRLNDYLSTINGVVKQFSKVHIVESDSQSGIWHVFHQIIRGVEGLKPDENTGIRQKSAVGRERLQAKL